MYMYSIIYNTCTVCMCISFIAYTWMLFYSLLSLCLSLSPSVSLSPSLSLSLSLPPPLSLSLSHSSFESMKMFCEKYNRAVDNIRKLVSLALKLCQYSIQLLSKSALNVCYSLFKLLN